MLFATFIAGSFVTLLVTFTGYKFTNKRRIAEQRKNLLEVVAVRKNILELSSNSNKEQFNDEIDKALYFNQIEQLSPVKQRMFAEFIKQAVVWKKEYLAPAIEKVRKAKENNPNGDYHDHALDQLGDLGEKFDKNMMKLVDYLSSAQRVHNRPFESEISSARDELYFIMKSWGEGNRHARKMKLIETYKADIMQRYDFLVEHYDPYYYISATKILNLIERHKTDNSASQEMLDVLYNKLLVMVKRLSTNDDIVELISQTSATVNSQSNLTLSDKNALHDFLSVLSSTNYLVEKNPTKAFNDDWLQFDVLRKEVARNRGIERIWILPTLQDIRNN